MVLSSNSHNWLYTRQQSIQLIQAYEQYKTIDDLSEIHMQIIINNNPKTYVIDFVEMVQYQQNDMNRIRNASKLTTNKIIGITGKRKQPRLFREFTGKRKQPRLFREFIGQIF